MKREHSKTDKQIVEAVVGLFVLSPNPELKDKKDEVIKIAFEVLDEMMDNSIKNLKENVEEVEEPNDGYLDGLIEESINEIIERAKKL